MKVGELKVGDVMVFQEENGHQVAAERVSRKVFRIYTGNWLPAGMVGFLSPVTTLYTLWFMVGMGDECELGENYEMYREWEFSVN